MTSTTGTTGTDEHPEVAEISALAEGILPPDRSADIREHLDDCVLCADVRSSLDEIRSLLGTLPGPPRMPADIAGRIDAALAAEALLDSAPHTTAVSRETATVSRETTAAPDRPKGHADASAGPGRTHPRTRRRWSKGLLVTTSVAVLGLGGFLGHSLITGGGGAGVSAESADSATSKHPPGMAARVHELLAAAYSGSGGSVHANGEDNTTRIAPAVPACVSAGIGRSDPVLTFDRGTYDGTDSYLVILPHGTDETRVDVYVVDASCTTAEPAATGKVLSKDTYAR